MKDFVHESLLLLGAEIRETSLEDCIFFQFDVDSQLADFLQPDQEHLLSFETERDVPGSIKVVPGCRFLDQLNDLLRTHSARHGLLPDKAGFSRKDIRSKFSVFSGKINRFSIKSSWRNTIRCHCKITVTGDELYEHLIVVEIPHHGLPSVTENTVATPDDIVYVDKPPLKQYEFRDLLEKSIYHAGIAAIEKAEELRKKSIRHLHADLEKIRGYYRQVRLETGGDKSIVDREYQLRKEETVQQAGIRSRTEIIAVETVSIPIKTATWTLENNNLTSDVTVELNSYDGTIIRPVQCDMCHRATEIFGLTNENSTVCPDCLSACAFCGKEVASENAREQWVCRECALPVCADHSSLCHVCGTRMCNEHLHDCRHKGCKVCRSCIRHCVECGNSVTWCPDHTTVNSHGIIICHEHAVTCAGCHEVWPAGEIETCSYCGQTVCPNCRTGCSECHKNFCLNHTFEGMCDACHIKKIRRNLNGKKAFYKENR
jgi:hypothetical protein